MRRSTWCALSVLLALVGCSSPAVNYVGKLCDNGQCPDDLVCEKATNTCQLPGTSGDAGPGRADAATPSDGGNLGDGGADAGPGGDGGPGIDGGTGTDAGGSDAGIPDGGSTVVLTLCPEKITLFPGESLNFTAFDGAAKPAVSWSTSAGTISSQSGAYVAPASAGSAIVRATLATDPTVSATAQVEIVPRTPVIGGTVTLNSVRSRTGRVYVALKDTWPSAATSVDGPGRPFQIRGFKGNNGQTYTARAWMDTLGVGTFNDVADPSGTANFVWNGADVTLAITITDPVVSTPPAPVIGAVVPGLKTALVMFDELRSSSGSMLADHYKLYVSKTPPVTVGSALYTFTARSGTGDAIIPDLPADPAGTNYYFALSAVADGLESPLSNQLVTMIPGTAPTGGNVISGKVDMRSVTTTSPLLVFVFPPAKSGPPAQMWLARIDNPSGIVDYQIANVPTGTYWLGALVDANHDGELGPNDPNTVRNGRDFTTIQVTSGQTLAPTVVLGAKDVGTSATTDTSYDMSSALQQWGVELTASPGRRLPVKVTVGAGMAGAPMDIGLWDNSSFQTHFSYSGTTPLPAVGQRYRLDVLFDDGVTCNADAVVSAVLPKEAAPTPLSPLGSATSPTPTFTWSPPTSIPTGANYYLNVRPVMNGGDVWRVDSMPMTQTSIVYNADGRANQVPLAPATSYSWYVGVSDSIGNRAEREVQFTTP